MNKYLFLFSLVIVIDGAYAVSETRFVSGESYYNIESFDTRNVYVESGACVYAKPENEIEVNSAQIYIYNDGIINGTINTKGENLFLYNTGEITGGIVAPNILSAGTVTQRITSKAEMTYIDVNALEYVIDIRDYTDLNFADIKDINANSFKITDSSIVIDNFTDWQNWLANSDVLLDGNISLKFVESIDNTETNTDTFPRSGDTIIDSASAGSANINVQIENMDNLYKTELENNGSGIEVHIVRETDYDKISNNQTNNNGTKDPLEVIRENDPNDKLVNAVDSANDKDEINQLKNASYRYNHSILLKPIMAINNFALNNSLYHKDSRDVGIDTYYITSNSSNVFGGRLFLNTNYKNTNFNLGLHLNRFDYNDSLNDFSGAAYGADINAKHNFDSMWVKAVFGTTLANYHADYVMNNEEVKNDPFAKSFYGDSDIGYDIMCSDKTTISPFVGMAYQKYSVTDVSISDVNVRAGSNIKYSFTVDDVRYVYSMSGSVNDDFDLFVKFNVGFVALTDMAGASFGLDIFRNDDDIYYKLSANAKIMF